jgi:DNA-binding MarR family transcriptional regulator
VAASRILSEIRQTRPFSSLEEETVVALLKTTDHIHRLQHPVLAPHGLTEQQYNVLRILRGAGPSGLPTLSVAERLIEQTPGITRLIDRLEAKQLVRRERPAADRRQVYCFITPAGLDLLTTLDPLVEQAARRTLRHLTRTEMRALQSLLEKIRDA